MPTGKGLRVGGLLSRRRATTPTPESNELMGNTPKVLLQVQLETNTQHYFQC